MENEGGRDDFRWRSKAAVSGRIRGRRPSFVGLARLLAEPLWGGTGERGCC